MGTTLLASHPDRFATDAYKSNYQEYMDEAAECIGRDHSQQPENQQNYEEMGYLLHSGNPYILWSAPSAFAKHFTIDL
jgi:hypothetical protein